MFETSRLPKPLRPFRHRDYRLLAGALTATLLSNGLWVVAVAWQVIALGGGPAELSVVATSLSLGLVLCVLFGGVAADRISRRTLLRGVELVRVTATALAGTLALTGVLQLWHLTVIAFVLGATGAFFFPAYSALLPALLPEEELLAANGMEGMLRPAAQWAFGPALGGTAVAAFSPGVAFLFNAGIDLAALLALLAMRPVSVPANTEANTEKRSILGDLGEGFGYMFRTGWLFATLAFACVFVLLILGPIEVLLPFAVRDQTGADAGGYAFVLGAFGFGGVLGSLAISSWRMPRRYLTWMLLSWGVGTMPVAVLGFATSVWLMAVASFLVGFADSLAMVIWGTLLQRRVPSRLLGRVSSLDFFVSLALLPVSMAAAGPVGEAIGLPLTFLLAGLLPALLALVALFAWRLPQDEIEHPLRPAA